MASNSNFVFASSEDQYLNAYTLDENNQLASVGEHIKNEGTLKMMQATDKFLYGLTFKGELVIRNADNLSEVVKTKADPAKADAVCMAVSEATNTIWIGDKTGAVTVLDAESLAPVELPAPLKTKLGAASYMAASHDGGNLIALGDAKGFVSIFDAASKTLKMYYAKHQSKIYGIEFNAENTWVQSVSQDKILAMCNVENRDDHRTL